MIKIWFISVQVGSGQLHICTFNIAMKYRNELLIPEEMIITYVTRIIEGTIQENRKTEKERNFQKSNKINKWIFTNCEKC